MQHDKITGYYVFKRDEWTMEYEQYSTRFKTSDQAFGFIENVSNARDNKGYIVYAEITRE